MAAVVEEQLALGSTPGRLAIAATVAASGMASLDATVVNVALPHIAHDLHSDVAALQWVLTGYLLSLASLILLGGAIGDRFGRRRVFEVGAAWFAVASLLCGLAPNVGVLVAARVLQGVGGALVTPGSLAILQASFRSEDRGRAVGAWSALGGIAGAIGPFLGGWIVDGPGWRWAFLINVPVAAVVLVCSRAAVPESRDEHAGRRFDTLGVVLGIVALAATTWALTAAGARGFADAGVLAALGAGGLTAVGFVAHLKRAPAPLVPPALFADRTFSVVNVGTAFLYGSVGLSFFLVTYELQVAAHMSALRAGVALLPTTLLMLVLSSRSGALAQRIGPRLQLTAGPLLTGAGLLLLTRIGEETQWWRDVLPGALVFGVGLAAFVAPLTATVMAAADADHLNVASAVNNAIARAASLAGLAVVPTVAGLNSATGPAATTHAFRVALVLAAASAAVAGPLMGLGLRPRQRCGRSLRKVHCAVDGPPLQPVDQPVAA